MSYVERLTSTTGWVEATESVDIARFERELGCTLPADYRNFVVRCGGFEGTFGKSYIQLNPAAKILKVNLDSEMRTFFPGTLAIGGTGGGEMFCIHYADRPVSYVLLP